MSWSLRLLLWSIAGLIALNLSVGTGLITGWGHWYSPSLPYRKQTEVMLAGRIALSTSPADIEHDMAWGEGGVQQVWGLGVPGWRLPFECLARLVGQPAFPDRIALAVAILVVSYFVLRVFTVSNRVKNVDQWLAECGRRPLRVAAAMLLILFPPIITLCCGPFNVYEEAVVYGYFYAIALFAATLAFAETPAFRTYAIVCLLTGLAAFVRPTMGAYGLATVVIAFGITRQEGWSWWRTLAGPALFALGCALLFWSNLVRFGSGLEFGHQLTLSALDLMYLLRFSTPIDSEQAWPAAKELFGSIFFVRRLNGFDVYGQDIVSWQSSLPRWRHYYHTTFDWTYLIGVVACWFTATLCLVRARKVSCQSVERESLIPAAWSFISVVMLGGFYLRLPAISSRYILDFAPAICIAIVGCILHFENNWCHEHRGANPIRMGVLVALAAWWISELFFAEQSFPPTPVLAQAEVLSQMDGGSQEFPTIPTIYTAESSPATAANLPQNGFGWGSPAGEVAMMVVLFVNDPGNIVLEVAPGDGESPSDEQFAAIQAKVGLEFLELKSSEPTERGRRLTFSAPEREAYRHGIQALFLGFLGSDQFPHGSVPFRLLRVEWNTVGH